MDKDEVKELTRADLEELWAKCREYWINSPVTKENEHNLQALLKQPVYFVDKKTGEKVSDEEVEKVMNDHKGTLDLLSEH